MRTDNAIQKEGLGKAIKGNVNRLHIPLFSDSDATEWSQKERGPEEPPDLVAFYIWVMEKSGDQIVDVIQQIKTMPNSRRMIVSAWNVGDIGTMALPPCHAFFQFYVADDKLSCQLYQRSADTFLGVPFNIASYALLTMMIAQVCELGLGDFVHTLGDAHLYSNHLEQAKLQLERDFRSLPTMKINPDIKDLFAFKYEDFELLNYDPHPHIKAAVAI